MNHPARNLLIALPLFFAIAFLAPVAVHADVAAPSPCKPGEDPRLDYCYKVKEKCRPDQDPAVDWCSDTPCDPDQELRFGVGIVSDCYVSSTPRQVVPKRELTQGERIRQAITDAAPAAGAVVAVMGMSGFVLYRIKRKIDAAPVPPETPKV